MCLWKLTKAPWDTICVRFISPYSRFNCLFPGVPNESMPSFPQSLCMKVPQDLLISIFSLLINCPESRLFNRSSLATSLCRKISLPNAPTISSRSFPRNGIYPIMPSSRRGAETLDTRQGTAWTTSSSYISGPCCYTTSTWNCRISIPGFPIF